MVSIGPDNQYLNKYTSTTPAVLHFPGDRNLKFVKWNKYVPPMRFDQDKVDNCVIELEMGEYTYKDICGSIDVEWKW